MKTIGNIIWFFLCGIELAILWAIAGLVCYITIIGIPLGVQCFKIAGFVIWPFGKDIEYGSGTVSVLANIIWAMTLGLTLALASISAGIAFCCTIIGIPFGIQCFKLAGLSFCPFGAVIK